jgi:uncharacterized delta-60 repeat protein
MNLTWLSRSARPLALLATLGLAACGVDDLAGLADEPLAAQSLALAGDLDPGFGPGGVVLTDVDLSSAASATAVRVQADGKIVLVGSASNGFRNVGVIARLQANGARDTTFGRRGWVSLDASLHTFFTDVQIAADGKLVAIGRTSDSAGGSQVLVARYQPDGTLDTSFAGDGVQQIAVSPLGLRGNAVRLQSDGKIVVAGELSTSSASDLLVVRLTSAGALDTSFAGLGWTSVSAGGAEAGTALALQSDGKIVVGGYTNSGAVTRFLAVRLLATGALDTSFSGDGIAPVQLGGRDTAAGVLVQSDGKIVLAGKAYGSDATNYDVGLVRLTSAGALDTSFSGDGLLTFSAGDFSDDAAALVQRPDGRLLVGGRVTRAGGLDDMLFVQVSSAGVLDTGFDGDGQRTVSFSGAAAGVHGLALQSDGRAVAAGVRLDAFDSRIEVVRLNTGGALDANFDVDGRVDLDLASGDDRAYDAVVQPDGKLVTVGRTDGGFLPRCLVTRYRTDGTLDTSFSNDGKLVFSFPVEAGCRLSTVALQPDGKLVVGADDASLRGWAFARITAAGALDPTFSGDGLVVHVAGSAFGGVKDLLVQPDGKLLAAVRIWQSGEDFAVARLNADGTLDTSFSGDGWTSTSFGVNNDMITRIALQPDGRIVAAGTSTDLSAAVITRFLTTGSVDGNFGLGGRVVLHTGQSGDSISSLAVQTDGKLLAAGTASDGFFASDMALWRFTASGAADTTFGPGGAVRVHPMAASGSTDALRLADGRTVLVGQGYDTTTGVSGGLFVRVTAAGVLDTSFGGGDGWTLQSIGTTCALQAVALQPGSGAYVGAGYATFEPLPGGGIHVDTRTAWDVLAVRVLP